MDCITHGRYGYTDPSGKQREYGYTSGVRCDPHNRKVRHLSSSCCDVCADGHESCEFGDVD